MAVAAVVTREGKIGDYALLEQVRRAAMSRASGTGGQRAWHGVLHAVRQSRFAPAQRPGGQVVAVNMVWLFARTTVKASQRDRSIWACRCTRAGARRAAAGRQAGQPAPPGASSAGRRRSSAGRARRSPQRPPDGGRRLQRRPRALDTLLSASAARSTTPCAACASGTVSSNCSTRESAMPSFG